MKVILVRTKCIYRPVMHGRSVTIVYLTKEYVYGRLPSWRQKNSNEWIGYWNQYEIHWIKCMHSHHKHFSNRLFWNFKILPYKIYHLEFQFNSQHSTTMLNISYNYYFCCCVILNKWFNVEIVFLQEGCEVSIFLLVFC